MKFEEREHVPLVGEIALRMRAKNTKGKVSVPLLVEEDGESVQGSLAIGQWADAHGKKEKLFPEGSRDRIVALYDKLEDTLSAARERFVRDLMTDREAQLESLPAMLRGLPFASLSAKVGTSFVANKYNARIGSVDDRMRAGLQIVREAKGDKEYIEGSFSFADIVGATVVQTIAPVEKKYLDVPPATRKLWEYKKLAKEFPDLIAWRDAIYEKHRPIGSS